jgi:hypothetical protein
VNKSVLYSLQSLHIPDTVSIETLHAILVNDNKPMMLTDAALLTVEETFRNMLVFPTDSTSDTLRDHIHSILHLDGMLRSFKGPSQTGADHCKETLVAVCGMYLLGGAGAGACTLMMEI